MTIDEAKRQAWLRKVGGIVLWVVSGLLVAAVITKSFYEYGAFTDYWHQWYRYYIDLAQYYFPPLAAVWPYVPGFNWNNPLSWSNIWTATPYIGIWIGRAVLRTGVKLAEDARETERMIRREEMAESLRPGSRRSAAEIRMSIEIPRPSFWRALVKTWLAPVVTAFVAGALLYLFGWN